MLAGHRVATVERTHPDCKDQVEGLFVGLQSEVLHRDLPDAQAAGGDLGGGVVPRLDDRLRRPVDGQDVARGQPGGYGSCRRGRTTSDLQDP